MKTWQLYVKVDFKRKRRDGRRSGSWHKTDVWTGDAPVYHERFCKEKYVRRALLIKD